MGYPVRIKFTGNGLRDIAPHEVTTWKIIASEKFNETDERTNV